MRLPALIALSLVFGACDDNASQPPPKEAAAQDKKAEAVAPAAPLTETAACDRDKLSALATMLETTPPKDQPDVVVSGLVDACPEQPEFLPDYFALAKRSGPGGPPGPQLAPASWKGLFGRSCPEHEKVTARLPQAPLEQRAALIFDGCDYQRFGLVERQAYVDRHPPHPIPFLVYQWLIEGGAPKADAQPIAQAIELFDRREQGPVQPTPALTVPSRTGPFDPVPATATVYVSQDSLRTARHQLLPLDSGRLPPDYVSRHLIGALFDQLAEAADKGKSDAMRDNEEWEGQLVIVADEQVPYDTIVDVLYTSGRAEFRRYAFVVDAGAFEYGIVPVDPPRFAAPKILGMGIGGATAIPAKKAPPLMVVIDSGGYEVHSGEGAAAKSERLGVRAGVGYEAWDYEALTSRAQAYRTANPDARSAMISPDGDIPYGVVVRTFAALRGPGCTAKTDCVLPEIIASSPGREP